MSGFRAGAPVLMIAALLVSCVAPLPVAGAPCPCPSGYSCENNVCEALPSCGPVAEAGIDQNGSGGAGGTAGAVDGAAVGGSSGSTPTGGAAGAARTTGAAGAAGAAGWSGQLADGGGGAAGEGGMGDADAGMAGNGGNLGGAAGSPPPAHAIRFNGGPMKNLYVDLVFWGANITDADRTNVFTYVGDLASWLNGGGGPVSTLPPGQEAAIHYYGVQGITPDLWLNDLTTPVPTSAIDDASFSSVIAKAVTGGDGAGYAYFDTALSKAVEADGLPSARNHLIVVVTKGTPASCLQVGDLLNCRSNQGYHAWNGTFPYGAVAFDVYRPLLSRVILEAMTDPQIDAGWSDSQNATLGDGNEVADLCQTQTTSAGSPYAQIDVNGSFATDIHPDPTSGCRETIPEQYAPMDATVESPGDGSQTVILAYVDARGHLQELSWASAGQPSNSPNDLGLPAPNVIATGKPSIVYSRGIGGERVFVRGSDSQLWMQDAGIWSGQGTDIRIYGSPKAVLLNGGALLDVEVLGIDDNLYWYEMTSTSVNGWSQVPYTDGLHFVGSPVGISRDLNSLDLFAVDEAGKLDWMGWSSMGWGSPKTIGSNGYGPFTATPVVTSDRPDHIQVFATSTSVGGSGMFETGGNGSSWSANSAAQFPVQSADNDFGVQGTPAVASWGAGRLDAFGVARSGNLYWWYTTNPTGTNRWQFPAAPSADPMPLTGDANGAVPVIGGAPLASGDPVAVSRSSDQLEVFYRAIDGSLVHLTYSNGAWLAPELLPVSIR